jgi:hypothetical protein
MKLPTGREPQGELLRAPQVSDWLGIKPTALRSIEAPAGILRPFQKAPGAQVYYLKSELIDVLGLPSAARSREPKFEISRLVYVLEWLGIPLKEFRSWAKLGLIRPHRLRGNYDIRAIKRMLSERKPRMVRAGGGRKTARARAERWKNRVKD